MLIRTAQLQDFNPTTSPTIAELIYSAGVEIYDFIYKTDKFSALDYIEYEFKSGKGFCGYPNVTVAEVAGQVVGTGCFYDGKHYNRLMLDSAINMIKFYGWGIVPVLLRSNHLKSVMKKPLKTELYLSNFGVAAHCRSQGIGAALIRHHLAQAQGKGYSVFGLDVVVGNERAEKLYTSLGLTVVAEKKFTGKRTGVVVPNSKKMELRITQS